MASYSHIWVVLVLELGFACTSYCSITQCPVGPVFKKKAWLCANKAVEVAILYVVLDIATISRSYVTGLEQFMSYWI